MSSIVYHRLLNLFIASVWFANGIFCKLLNMVPRHQEIVERILGPEHALLFTRIIGSAETAMGIWILSGLWPRLNTATQIAVIAAMNTLEFFLAPDLLLWGRWNALFAFLFIVLIWYNGFVMNKKSIVVA